MNIRSKIFSLFLFISGSVVCAQDKIVNKLQERNAGEGVVTIHQDPMITSLIGSIYSGNNPGTSSQSNNTASHTGKVGSTSYESVTSNVPVEHKFLKARGFRIQVYAGNNSRVAKNEALNIANRVKSEFPDIPVYTYFLPPRWLCRVGDYRSMEEAHAVLRQLKATGLFKEASIVKEQINIPID